MISLWLIIISLLVACGEEETWQELNDENVEEELTLFMYEYKNGWEQSLSTQSFSIMEKFFVGNSQVFHMERKQHQQLTGERKVEMFIEATDINIEVNQFNEWRIYWNEVIEVDQVGTIHEETRARRYYISEGRNGYQITAIERSDEINEHSF
ncbi:TcaA NTF2-like domain-containing protein [Salipaludibacillus daqingensis]|uniref:TcaA NTF2-like domain-containing protein n=1 Tax=Salipaludibacillus daqingensis TaxID=3041001 RepID=UPI003CC8CCA6